MKRLVLLGATAAVALAVACNPVPSSDRVAEKLVEQATGMKVDTKNDSVSIKGPEGQSVTFSSAAPEELKDFPVPTGFKWKEGGSVSGSGPQSSGRMATGNWTGKATIAEVASFYKKTATERGWTESLTFSDNENGQAHYKTKENSALIVGYSLDEGNIDLTVMLTSQ